MNTSNSMTRQRNSQPKTPLHDPLVDLHGISRFEGRLSRQQLEEHHAGTPPVDREGVPFAGNNLWTEVVRSPTSVNRQGEPALHVGGGVHPRLSFGRCVAKEALRGRVSCKRGVDGGNTRCLDGHTSILARSRNLAGGVFPSTCTRTGPTGHGRTADFSRLDRHPI